MVRALTTRLASLLLPLLLPPFAFAVFAHNRTRVFTLHFPTGGQVPVYLDPVREPVEVTIERALYGDISFNKGDDIDNVVREVSRYFQEAANGSYHHASEEIRLAWQALQAPQGHNKKNDGWLDHADETCRQQTRERADEVLGLLQGELRFSRPACVKAGSLERAVGGCALETALRALAAMGYDLTPVVDEADRGVAPGVVRVGDDPLVWADMGHALAREEQMGHAWACYHYAYELCKASSSNPYLILELKTFLASALQALGGWLEVALSLYQSVLADPSLTNNHPKREGGEFLAISSMALRIKAVTLLPPILPHSQEIITSLRDARIDDLHTLLSLAQHPSPEVVVADPLIDLGMTAFHLSHQGRNDRIQQEAMAQLLLSVCPSLHYQAPHCHPLLPSSIHSRPLRVGFLSHHLYDHSIGRMWAHLLLNLANSSSLEIHVFSSSSRGPHEDVILGHLAQAVHAFHTLPYHLQDAQHMVAGSELDVLVYPDVGMEPLSYYLSFSRLAPIQMTWWGHPITTSSPAMDYFISLEEEIPEAHNHYTEQLVRMKWVNLPPMALELDKPPLMELEEVLGQAAVKEGLNIYLVLGRLFKLHPDFDEMMLQLLAQDKRAMVVLIHEKKHESWTAATWDRIKSLALSSGRSWCLPRLRIIHHWNYLKVLSHATAVLDTYPYGGCLTALDAMAHAIPIVTLPSPYIRGRFTVALYRQMEVMDCVATTKEDFLRLATRLGHDTGFREKVVRPMVSNHHLLPRVEEVAKEWELLLIRLARSNAQEAPKP